MFFQNFLYYIKSPTIKSHTEKHYMVYKNYGITFKNMRKQSRFTLADFHEVGLSTSTLSDFERGVSMISVEKLDLALQLLGYSLSDFDNVLNSYYPSDSDYLLQEIEKNILFNDTISMKKLYDRCKKNQKYISLAIKFILGEGRIEEKNQLINYLYETRYYGLKELAIFYIIMHQLVPQDILNIMNRLRKYAKLTSYSETYHRYLSHVILEAIIVLTSYHVKDKSDYYIKKVEELKLAQNMLLRNLFKATKGLWIYHFEDKYSGTQQVKQALKILHLGAEPEVAKFHKKKFEAMIDFKI